MEVEETEKELKWAKTKKNIIFTLIRGLIEYIHLFVLFVIIGFYANKLETIFHFVVMGIASIVVYVVLSSILSKYIKLQKFPQYLFSNIISLILCTVSEFITLAKYFDIANFSSDGRFWYVLVFIILNATVQPIMFIINLILDSKDAIRNAEKVENIEEGEIHITEQEFSKKLKWTKIFCVVIGITMILSLGIAITSGNIMNIFKALAILIMLYLFYSLTKKENIAGPILGIILGILYILQSTIFSIIIGAFIITDCISMLKYIKRN